VLALNGKVEAFCYYPFVTINLALRGNLGATGKVVVM